MILGTAARNAAVNAVVDLVDAGPGAGTIKIKSEAGVILVSIALARPAFGDALIGAATASGLPRSGVGTAAAGTGTSPATYDVCDSLGVVVWSGTIPGNMLLDSASIAENQTVNVLQWTHAQPAS